MPKTLYMPLTVRQREKYYSRKNVFLYPLGGLCIVVITYWLWWAATCCESGTEYMASHLNFTAGADSKKMESSFPILKLMSWNVQGLMRAELEKRIDAIKSIILKEEPDAVFFQELIPSSYKQLVESLSNYDSVLGTENPGRSGYFTGIFYNKIRLKMENMGIIRFKHSVMERSLLMLRLSFGKIKIALLTSHLESMPHFKTQRLEQLTECFKVCTSLPTKYNVIFGGDLNLEEEEEDGLVPENIKDLWIECGSLEASKFTWDFTENKNDQLPDNGQPQRRYDRLYFRSSNPSTMYPERFKLLGKDMVEGTSYHPSDHWALLATFKIPNQFTT